MYGGPTHGVPGRGLSMGSRYFKFKMSVNQCIKGPFAEESRKVALVFEVPFSLSFLKDFCLEIQLNTTKRMCWMSLAGKTTMLIHFEYPQIPNLCVQ